MKKENETVKQFEQLLDRSKTNRKLLQALKVLAVKSQSFELAADLRELEIINFPDTDEIKKLREKADLIKRIFEIADLRVDEKTCMKVELLMNLINDLGGKSSLDDIVEINHFVNNIYPEL